MVCLHVSPTGIYVVQVRQNAGALTGCRIDGGLCASPNLFISCWRHIAIFITLDACLCVNLAPVHRAIVGVLVVKLSANGGNSLFLPKRVGCRCDSGRVSHGSLVVRAVETHALRNTSRRLRNVLALRKRHQHIFQIPAQRLNVGYFFGRSKALQLA